MTAGPPFADRHEAGERLLAPVRDWLARRSPPPGDDGIVVLALPRGGLPVAAPVAEGLGAPLDLALVRKVGAPGQPEVALGAVSGPGAEGLWVNERIARAFGLDRDAVARLAAPALAELDRRRAAYLGDAPALPLRDRWAVVVDDGVATGATMGAALRLIRAAGARGVLMAVPVAPETALAALAPLADGAICLESPEPFHAVGQAYRSFPQLDDSEVTAILARHRPRGPA